MDINPPVLKNAIAKNAIAVAWSEYAQAVRQLRSVYFDAEYGEYGPKPRFPERVARELEDLGFRLEYPLIDEFPIVYVIWGKKWTPVEIESDSLVRRSLQIAGTPQRVWRLVSLLERARRWCLRASDGIRRAREEIVRQQTGAIKKLEAYVALRKL